MEKKIHIFYGNLEKITLIMLEFWSQLKDNSPGIKI